MNKFKEIYESNVENAEGKIMTGVGYLVKELNKQKKKKEAQEVLKIAQELQKYIEMVR